MVTPVPATMRAARLARRGGPDEISIDDVPVPEPGRGEALIRVQVAAITASELGWEPTWTHRDGTDRTPVIPSHEMAGTVVATGADVSGVESGQPVFGLTDFFRDGAAAEYVVVGASDLAVRPVELDGVSAATLPLSGLTAWQALFDHGGLVAGQRVLIHGAAGGVGMFAVQLGHWRGAHVVAVGAKRDRGLLGRLGADVVLDRDDAPFGSEAAGMDLVVDTVGGGTLERSWPLLAPGGRLVSIAPSARDVALRDPRGSFFIVTPERAALERLADLVIGGHLRAIVDRTFLLAEARDAYAYAIHEHPRGKVVLRVAA